MNVSKRIISFILGALSSLFFIFLILASFRSAQGNQSKTLGEAESTNSAKTVAPTNTPTSTPTSTPTPKPKQNPNSFCLNVPVLQYHHVQPAEEAKKLGQGAISVTPETFDKQLEYLKQRGYTAISAEQLVQALRQHTPMPGKTVVITLDDGYTDNYLYAFQTAKKYGLILNLMVTTGLVENPGYLTWGQLQEMVGSGLVFTYAHSWSHYALSRGDTAKVEMEILTAKKQLEERLGRTVTIFTYPYGISTPAAVEILKANGFFGAFGTISSFTNCEEDLFNLHRVRIGNTSLASHGL